jgi:hypothetical protein
VRTHTHDKEREEERRRRERARYLGALGLSSSVNICLLRSEKGPMQMGSPTLKLVATKPWLGLTVKYCKKARERLE